MGKILVFSTQLLNTGGIESHLLEFCRVISSAGHSIDLLVPKNGMDQVNIKKLKCYCSNVYLKNNFDSTSSALFTFILCIRLILRKYDALYTNGQGNMIFLLSKLFRYKKHIHHHHTSGDLLDQQTWPLMYERVMKKADIVVACSSINADRLTKKLRRPVISLPVFSRDLQSCISWKKSKDVQVHFGYFGRLIPEKGIDVICKLSEEYDCKHIIFHLWGEGHNYTTDSFSKYKNLRYHGVFNGVEELKAIIVKLDGYLLLSIHHEGLPVSLLEVMSAGLPWLATDKGGIPDLYVDDNSTRIIKPDASYAEIKAAVIQFSYDCLNQAINTESVRKLYDQKYTSIMLLNKWEHLLNINPGHK